MDTTQPVTDVVTAEVSEPVDAAGVKQTQVAQEVNEPEEFVSESEYKTATEFIPEFQSDNEPPEDKIAEQRMIFKTQKLRIYKKILKVGRGNYMPAKYDRVSFKQIDTEIESLNTRELDSSSVQTGQLGIDIQDEELVCCLSNMKESEVSTFTIERVTYTEKKKRILESTRYLLADMQRWDTIIDLFGDMLCMKNITHRGIGQRRFNTQDEVSFKARVYQHEHTVLFDLEVERKLLKDLPHSLPAVLMEVLLTSKAKEKSKSIFEWEWVQEKENDEDLLSKLTAGVPVVVEIELQEIIEVMDLFSNGSVLKKVTKFSYSTAGPDENSCVFFDYMAYDSKNNII